MCVKSTKLIRLNNTGYGWAGTKRYKGTHMNGADLGVIEDTLFVPMLGRIYASENFRSILYDNKALELKDKLPEGLFEKSTQTQYTYLASASRSANMDRHITDFLKRKSNGIIVQLGSGLETTYYRDDNGHTKWYAIDLPHVIEYRKRLLPEPEREKYISGDAFREEWIKQIRCEHPYEPVIITASGLFYYFEKTAVLNLMKMLEKYGDIEIVFDTVNKSGMTMMKKKHLKTVGHEDAQMFFYVDSAKELISEIGSNEKIISEEKFYANIDKTGLKTGTKLSMKISDLTWMVKMIHLKL